MRKGPGAIVTSSTGIGLAMAQALARAGTNMMLNGYGDRGAIEGAAPRARRRDWLTLQG